MATYVPDYEPMCIEFAGFQTEVRRFSDHYKIFTPRWNMPPEWYTAVDQWAKEPMVYGGKRIMVCQV